MGFHRNKNLIIFFINLLLLIAAIIAFVVFGIVDWIVAVVIVVFMAPLAIWLLKIKKFFSQQIKNINSQLLDIIQNLIDGVVAYDLNYNVWLVNRAMENIIGLSSRDVIGRSLDLKNLASLKQKKEFDCLIKIFYPSLAPLMKLRTESHIYPQIIDMALKDPDKEFRITNIELYDENKRKTGYLKIVRDRTRELELLRSKSEFVTIASHQLRTPLAALNWVFQGLSSETLSESQKQMVDMGVKVSKNLSTVVEDLLNVANIEGGAIELKLEEIELNSFIKDIVADFKALSAERSVEVEFKEGRAVKFSFDKEKVKMLLSNLIDNAIKYNRPGGKATISFEELVDRPFIKIIVEDNGIGIPKEALDKMFTKFFRAENVLRQETEGSGLGLYIAKNIVEAHGGEIKLESVLNQGTKVYIALPKDPNLVLKKGFAFTNDN